MDGPYEQSLGLCDGAGHRHRGSVCGICGILFELDWMPDHTTLGRAFTKLYGNAPNPPMKE